MAFQIWVFVTGGLITANAILATHSKKISEKILGIMYIPVGILVIVAGALLAAI